ncbi:hypothetical protein Hanom_Chr07g00611791 [Helianthus anomalus]
MHESLMIYASCFAYMHKIQHPNKNTTFFFHPKSCPNLTRLDLTRLEPFELDLVSYSNAYRHQKPWKVRRPEVVKEAW